MPCCVPRVKRAVSDSILGAIGPLPTMEATNKPSTPRTVEEQNKSLTALLRSPKSSGSQHRPKTPPNQLYTESKTQIPLVLPKDPLNPLSRSHSAPSEYHTPSFRPTTSPCRIGADAKPWTAKTTKTLRSLKNEGQFRTTFVDHRVHSAHLVGPKSPMKGMKSLLEARASSPSSQKFAASRPVIEQMMREEWFEDKSREDKYRADCGIAEGSPQNIADDQSMSGHTLATHASSIRTILPKDPDHVRKVALELNQHFLSELKQNKVVTTDRLTETTEYVRKHRFFDRELNAAIVGEFVDDVTCINCPVCKTIAADRCLYCFRSKTSTEPRMHLKELGEAILRSPKFQNMNCSKLLELLHKYGRSTEFARRINQALHWPQEGQRQDTLYCAKHNDMWSDLEDYTAYLELERKQMMALLQKAGSRLQELYKDLEELRVTADKAQADAARAKNHLNGLRLQKMNSDSKSSKQKNRLKGNTYMVDDLRKHNMKLQKENDKLQRQLEDAMMNAERLEESNTSVAGGTAIDEIERLVEEVDDLKSKLAKLRLQLHQRDKQMQDLQERFEHGMPESPTAKDALTQESKAKDDKIKSLQAELDSMTEQGKTLRQELAKEKSTKLSLELQLGSGGKGEKKAENDGSEAGNLRAQLEELMKRFQEATLQSSDQLESQRRELESLRSQMGTLTSDNSRLQSQVEQQAVERETLRSKLLDAQVASSEEVCQNCKNYKRLLDQKKEEFRRLQQSTASSSNAAATTTQPTSQPNASTPPPECQMRCKELEKQLEALRKQQAREPNPKTDSALANKGPMQADISSRGGENGADEEDGEAEEKQEQQAMAVELESDDALDTAVRGMKKLCPLSKFVNKKAKKMLTYEQTLDMIYDIYEKKCEADEVDLRKGNELDCMLEYLEEHFQKQYGVPKMVQEKLTTFIQSLMKYESRNKRVQLFMFLIGLKHERLYTTSSGHLMTRMLSRRYRGQLKAIKEHFEEGRGKCFVDKEMGIDMIIGFDVGRSHAWHWDCPELYQVATAGQIEDLLDSIEELPEASGLVGGKKAHDLDQLIELVFDQYIEWLSKAEHELRDSFKCFDSDMNGLELTEFKIFLSDLVKIEMTHKEANKLWKKILEKAGMAKSDDMIFTNPNIFAVVCMQENLFPFVEKPKPQSPPGGGSRGPSRVQTPEGRRPSRALAPTEP